MEELTKNIVSSDVVIYAVGILITLFIKDIIETYTKGLLFKLNKNFNVGDDIIFNDKEGTIISIGLRQTIIELDTEDNKTWIYVYNDRLKYMSLGKIKKRK